MKIKSLFLKSILAFICTLIMQTPLHAKKGKVKIPRATQGLKFLSFQELKELSQSLDAYDKHVDKINALLNSYELSNWATKSGKRPHRVDHETLGESIGVTSWNIEESLSVKDRLIPALKEGRVFRNQIKKLTRDKTAEIMEEQREKLLSSDIVILQEQDYGVTRSGYINSTKQLAQAFGMNYAYAPYQIEVDPKKFIKANPKHYKGVFGAAILSRYKIKSVKLRHLESQVYNWNVEERHKWTNFEKIRRYGGKVFLGESTEPEIRIGGQHLFLVDLDVPGVPNNTITVVNVHLEIKAAPEDRVTQIKEILEALRDIKNPVIMAGDFNSSLFDISPTSLKEYSERYVKNVDNIPSHIGRALDYSLGSSTFGLANTARWLLNTSKNFNRPTAMHIPILFPNNRKELFNTIQNFRFDDGSCFDFRGTPGRSFKGDKLRAGGYIKTKRRRPGHKGLGKGLLPSSQQKPKNVLMGNSNHRESDGKFRTSFETDRTPLDFGTDRLDFMFVKSGLIKDCGAKAYSASYRLAPHFGQTFKEFNRHVRVKYSDHDPIYTILPINEPKVLNQMLESKKSSGLIDRLKKSKEEKAKPTSEEVRKPEEDKKPNVFKRIGNIFRKNKD